MRCSARPADQALCCPESCQSYTDRLRLAHIPVGPGSYALSCTSLAIHQAQRCLCAELQLSAGHTCLLACTLDACCLSLGKHCAGGLQVPSMQGPFSVFM